MGEPICPVTKDGLHQKRPWQGVKGARSGLACQACHKTWTFHGHARVPTFEESGHGG